jgi:PAS domain S-box-containing protein
MSPKNHDTKQASSANAGFHKLHSWQRPEWKRINFGGRYWDDYKVLGKNILISQPSGYANEIDTEQSLKLNHEVVRVGIPENTPYIQIQDYSNLTGATLSSRKLVINERSKWDNLIAVIFCNISPIMKVSIEFAKRIYSFPFDVRVAKNLSEAIDLGLNILRLNNIICDPTPPLIEKKPDPSVLTKKEWTVQCDGFSLRFEVIDGDILHPVPVGSPQQPYIDLIFEVQARVVEESGLKDGSYCLMSDLAAMKGADMKTRRYFVTKIREWHRRHPFKMLIFYHASWVMRAAINISKPTAPYDVFVVDTFDQAMDLARKHKSNASSSLNTINSDISPGYGIDSQMINELYKILSGISWETETPESILHKVGHDHPFRQIVDAVSLIKMDVDHLLTEKESSEKALRESNERYKSILDNIEEGYYEVDISGRFTFFNTSMSAILGYSEEEMIGMDYRHFSSPNDVNKIFNTFNHVFKTGQPAKALDWKLIRKNGETCFIEASVALVKNNQNQPCGFRGICRDISYRITAEREKQKMADRLRQAQKMEAIGTLAGGVAHDLNNILSGIVSYPDLLLMKIPETSPLRRPIETIKKSGERAAAIVADLLTLARRGIPKRDIVNLNDIIADYLKSPEYEYLMTHHPLVDVIPRLDSGLLNISASSIHILKVIMNLITNAAEAMPDGGKLLIVAENFNLDTPMPEAVSLKMGDYVRLQVIDEGVGIAEEDRERIFEPFYTKKIMGRSGSGLGMTLVWGAVQDHDGYIDVQSAPDKGTAITIFFPALRNIAPAIKEDFAVDGFKGNGESVLVVDDLPEQREIAHALLTQLGYVVHMVPSGEAAIDYLKTRRVDLVVLDMIMEPGMDGLDTYKEIIRNHPKMKAVIATGFSTSERIQAAQSLGAGPCLKKPYLLQDIARIVREALDR